MYFGSRWTALLQHGKRPARVCEGAFAEKASVERKGDKIIATFQTQGLLNVPAGATVAFAVKAIAEFKGQKVSLEGVDTVKRAR